MPKDRKIPIKYYQMAIIEFAEWLQEELDKRDWRQADLARYGGIATSMLSRVMTGERSPGPDTCVSIARAFRMPPEDVFRKAGLLPLQQNETETQREMRFLFDQLDEQAQATVIAMLRGYVREAANPRPSKTPRAPA